MYSEKENVNILTAMLVAYGIHHVVVCPGSRNAPLVHNFNQHPAIVCHPVTDERSAAFVALGISLAEESPVAVCVTSGSALLNTLPGVVEASYQQRGIIVISADRPQAWIDQLDGQTLPQPGALGQSVAKSVSLPEPHDDEERWFCRRLIHEAMLALHTTHRSVHINVPITEPLFKFTVDTLPAETPLTIIPDISQLIRLIEKRQPLRPMIVVGQTNTEAMSPEVMQTLRQHFVVIAEQLSVSVPSPSLDIAIELMADRQADYRPDLLIYMGGNTVSKRLRHFLRTLTDCTVILCNESGELHDPTQHATHILKATPSQALAQLASATSVDCTEYQELWGTLFQQTRQAIASRTLSFAEYAVKEFESHVSHDDAVFYANSSSIRMATRHAVHYVYCNRGVNGIEGSLSTAAGFSLASLSRKTYCVIGDLSFFYDQNALWNNHLGGNFRILLLNDGGGSIFRQLPGLEASPARDTLVMASHHTTAEGICHQNGIIYRSVTDMSEIPQALHWLTGEESSHPLLLEVIL